MGAYIQLIVPPKDSIVGCLIAVILGLKITSFQHPIMVYNAAQFVQAVVTLGLLLLKTAQSIVYTTTNYCHATLSVQYFGQFFEKQR
jgi:hypothetical protein